MISRRFSSFGGVNSGNCTVDMSQTFLSNKNKTLPLAQIIIATCDPALFETPGCNRKSSVNKKNILHSLLNSLLSPSAVEKKGYTDEGKIICFLSTYLDALTRMALVQFSKGLI